MGAVKRKSIVPFSAVLSISSLLVLLRDNPQILPSPCMSLSLSSSSFCRTATSTGGHTGLFLGTPALSPTVRARSFSIMPVFNLVGLSAQSGKVTRPLALLRKPQNAIDRGNLSLPDYHCL